MLHHQLVREVGVAYGILKPTAGKQYGGTSLTTDLASVWFVWLLALNLFTVKAHCTCSMTRDPMAITLRADIIMAVENRITIEH